MDGHPASSVPPFHGRIILASLGMLCLLLLSILILDRYARWFWRYANRRLAFLRNIRLDQQQQSPDLSNDSAGLHKALLYSMPTFRYHTSSVDGGNGLVCAVCLSEFRENENCRMMPKCKHSFHSTCIDVWFCSHITCPLCRTVVASPDVRCSNERSQIHQQLSQDHQAERQDADNTPVPSLPCAGWAWMRSTSTRFSQRQAVQFATNVLFWGDHAQVTSQVNMPVAEHGHRGGLLPHLAITVDVAAMHETGGEDEACRPQNDSYSKPPAAPLSTITRLLSCGERRVYPSVLDQATEATIGSTSNSAEARV